MSFNQSHIYFLLPMLKGISAFALPFPVDYVQQNMLSRRMLEEEKNLLPCSGVCQCAPWGQSMGKFPVEDILDILRQISREKPPMKHLHKCPYHLMDHLACFSMIARFQCQKGDSGVGSVFHIGPFFGALLQPQKGAIYCICLSCVLQSFELCFPLSRLSLYIVNISLHLTLPVQIYLLVNTISK